MAEKPNDWKRFPFVDNFPEHQRFYSMPHTHPDGFRRASMHLPVGFLQDPPEGGNGRVLNYGQSPDDEDYPCFTLDYMLACFGVAALQVRHDIFNRLNISSDRHLEHVDLYISDAFRMKIYPPMISDGYSHKILSENRDVLDKQAQNICSDIYKEYYEEAREHYISWYSWARPNMSVHISPQLPKNAIAEIIGNTKDESWIPSTALIIKSRKELDKERFDRGYNV